MTDETLSFHDEPAAAGPATCSRCHLPISQYWSIDGGVYCERCMHEVLAQRTSSEGAGTRVVKALTFGLGGMLAGAIVWYAVAKYADLQIGLIAILLGWLVGKGIQHGSGKRGGLGYQLLAVTITYLGIGLASVPFVLEGAAEKPAVVADSLAGPATDAEFATLDSAIGAGQELEHDANGPAAAIALGLLALVALAFTLPVLVVFKGGSLITGIIYAIALYEAWKHSRGVAPAVSGPHQVGAAS